MRRQIKRKKNKGIPEKIQIGWKCNRHGALPRLGPYHFRASATLSPPTSLFS